MMKKPSVVLFVFCVLVGSLTAQETVRTSGPATTQVPTDKIKVRVDLVNVLMTVTNKKKRLEINLGKDEFPVFRD